MGEPLRPLIATLVRYRDAAGLTQAELAARAGTTQSAISDLERGLVEPRLSTLHRYAAAVGVTLTITVTPDEARVLELLRLNSLLSEVNRGSA